MYIQEKTNTVKMYFYLSVVLLFSLYAVMTLTKITGGLLSYIDDVIIVFFIVIIIFIADYKDVFIKLVIVYCLYSVFLILKNRIPYKNVMQIFLNLKFFFAFMLFYYLSKKSNRYNYSVFLFVAFFLFYFLIMELFDQESFILFFNAKNDKRGLFGNTIVSMLGSRVFFADFLVVLIILLLNRKIKFTSVYIKYVFVFAIFLLLFISYSRKEMLYGFVLILIEIKRDLKKIQRLIYYSMVIPIISMVFVYVFFKLFGDINRIAVSEEYIRFLLIASAVQVFMKYFPFGSGPGSYGSVMSIGYRKVYDELNISLRVVGTEDNPGPIYDAYAFNLLAEYGIGIILYFLFFYFVYKRSCYIKPEDRRTVRSLLAFSGFLSLTTPIFTNFIGILIFSIIGSLFFDSKNETRIV